MATTTYREAYHTLVRNLDEMKWFFCHAKRFMELAEGRTATVSIGQQVYIIANFGDLEFARSDTLCRVAKLVPIICRVNFKEES